MSVICDPLLTSSVAFSTGLWLLADWIEADPGANFVEKQVCGVLESHDLRALHGLAVYDVFLNGLEYALRRRGYETAAEIVARRRCPGLRCEVPVTVLVA